MRSLEIHFIELSLTSYHVCVLDRSLSPCLSLRRAAASALIEFAILGLERLKFGLIFQVVDCFC